jgi:hypothetical protein
MEKTNALTIRLSGPALTRFAPIFSSGVGIETTSGLSMIQLLCDQLGIPSVYIDQRVQTIFLNGRTVDRIDQTCIAAGDVIALSAAMPGLAGATLRKGGVLAAFRKEISYTDTADRAPAHQKAIVTLKLFNLVAKELCGDLLSKGVWVKGKVILTHLRQFHASPGAAGPEMICNGRSVSTTELAQLCRPDDWIFLSAQQ